jgi:metal-responsive CopG/Arc/MetJ family transcriptional regulator
MQTRKTHIHLRLPVQLLKEIDSLAGPRKRSAFFAAAVERELTRRAEIGLQSEHRGGTSTLEKQTED